MFGLFLFSGIEFRKPPPAEVSGAVGEDAERSGREGCRAAADKSQAPLPHTLGSIDLGLVQEAIAEA